MKRSTRHDTEPTAIMFLSLPIFAGLMSMVNFKETEKLVELYWQLVLFTLLLGSLIVSIKIKHLEKSDQESFPRLGFSTIIAGIIILIGNGIVAFNLNYTGNTNNYLFIIGQFFGLIGTYILAICISALFMVAGRTIIDLRK